MFVLNTFLLPPFIVLQTTKRLLQKIILFEYQRNCGTFVLACNYSMGPNLRNLVVSKESFNKVVNNEPLLGLPHTTFSMSISMYIFYM